MKIPLMTLIGCIAITTFAKAEDAKMRYRWTHKSDFLEANLRPRSNLELQKSDQTAEMTYYAAKEVQTDANSNQHTCRVTTNRENNLKAGSSKPLVAPDSLKLTSDREWKVTVVDSVAGISPSMFLELEPNQGQDRLRITCFSEGKDLDESNLRALHAQYYTMLIKMFGSEFSIYGRPLKLAMTREDIVHVLETRRKLWHGDSSIAGSAK